MRARSKGLPHWHKGRLLYENYSGFWYGSREGKLINQEGKLVDKKNFDKTTIKTRNESIQRRTR